MCRASTSSRWVSASDPFPVDKRSTLALRHHKARYAGFVFGRHGWRTCRKCRSIFRRTPWTAGHAGNAGAFSGERHGWPDMPEMQEHFPANAMDGGLSRPSMASEGPSRPFMVFGALGLLSIALGLLPSGHARNAGAILAAMDGGHAENAGAIFDRHGWRACRKCRSNFRPADNLCLRAEPALC